MLLGVWLAESLSTLYLLGWGVTVCIQLFSLIMSVLIMASGQSTPYMGVPHVLRPLQDSAKAPLTVQWILMPGPPQVMVNKLGSEEAVQRFLYFMQVR